MRCLRKKAKPGVHGEVRTRPLLCRNREVRLSLLYSTQTLSGNSKVTQMSINLILLLTCFASFTWAIRRFFTRPAAVPSVARLVSLLGGLTVLAYAAAWLLIPRPPARSLAPDLLASGLFAAALALFYWALRANLARPLSGIGAPDLPGHLVTAGPYRYVRHPFYLSYLLTWLGSALAASTAWLWLPVPVAVLLYVLAARHEERKFAASPLAAAYAAYARSTGMLLPRLWPLRPPVVRAEPVRLTTPAPDA